VVLAEIAAARMGFALEAQQQADELLAVQAADLREVFRSCLSPGAVLSLLGETRGARLAFATGWRGAGAAVAEAQGEPAGLHPENKPGAPAAVFDLNPGRTIRRDSSRPFTWGTTALAGTALGISLYYNLAARSSADQLSSANHPRDVVQSLSDDYTSARQRSYALFAVGLGLAAVAAALFLLRY
jgi:hypothetical protein